MNPVESKVLSVVVVLLMVLVGLEVASNTVLLVSKGIHFVN